MELGDEFFRFTPMSKRNDSLGPSFPDRLKESKFYLGDDLKLRPFATTLDLTVDVAFGTGGTITHRDDGFSLRQEEIFEVEKYSHSAHTGNRYSYVHQGSFSRTIAPMNKKLGFWMEEGGPVVTAYFYSWWAQDRLVRFGRRMIAGGILRAGQFDEMAAEYLDGLAYARTNGGVKLTPDSLRGVFYVPCVEVYVPGLAMDLYGYNYQPFDNNNLIYRVQADSETGELDYRSSIPNRMYNDLEKLRETTKPHKRFPGLDF